MLSSDYGLRPGDKLPVASVEMPPNKAIAAGGSAGIGSIVVGLALYYFAPDTPPEISGLWNALANTIIAFASVYMTPHGAMFKQ